MTDQTLQSWRGHIARYIEQNARPIEKYGHQPRLWAICMQLAEPHPEADRDILHAAAMLHDIGVFTGHRPEEKTALESWDMIAYAERTLPPLLREWQFPNEKIEPVLDCIRTHQPHHTPATIEATILRDADILEQLGGIGILRTVCKVGRDNPLRILHPSHREPRTSPRHSPSTPPPPEAHTLAEPRIALHREFLKGVRAEAGALLL